MDVVLTGTGNPLPDPNRAGASTLIKAGNTHVLVDAGRGVVMRMAGAGTLPVFLSGVCVTHLHSDHLCDLNDVITTHWILSQGSGTLAIFGPVGIATFVERQMHALEADVGYRIAHHDALTAPPKVDVTELEPGDAFTIADVQVTTAATMHAPVHPSIGFRFEHEGSTAALVGDTRPCAGVDELAAGAGVYVQSVLRQDLIAANPNAMLRDILDYHSSVEDAAQTAARAGVGTLALTHMIPGPSPDQYDEWRAQAAAHFSGTVVIGDDLTTITV